jgi:inosine/xanthosine triphosphatase
MTVRHERPYTVKCKASTTTQNNFFAARSFIIMTREADHNNKEVAQPAKRRPVLRVAVGTVNPAKIRAVDQALRRAAAESDADDDDLVDFEISGFDVDSRVPDQPFGDQETLQGAKNRAQAAYQAYRNAHQRTPHLAVGMEGGLEWVDHHQGGGQQEPANEDAAASENDNDDHTGTTASSSSSSGTGKLYCMAWMAIFGRREAITVELFATSALESYCADNTPVFGLAKTSMFPIPDAVAALVKQGMELGEADDRVFHRVQSKHGNGLVGLLTGGIVDRSEYYEQALVLALSPWMRSDLYPTGN